MHTITRGVIAAAALVGAAVGLAAPASAELTDGTYQMTYSSRPRATRDYRRHFLWRRLQTRQMVGPYTATEYHLQGDTWTAPSSDGSPKTIDNNTLAGLSSTWAYQLTKVG